MTSVRIGVDMDGVLYDWGEAMRSYIASVNPAWTRDRMADPSVWNTWEAWGMDKAEFFRYFREGVDAGHVWWIGDLEDDAGDVLERFRRDGHTIHIVTHRHEKGATGMANTCLWLEREGVPFDTLTFASDKCCVPVDIFIEDNVDNYLALEAAGVLPVLFTRPWNVNDPRPFRRVNSFVEFGDLVDRYVAWRTEYPLLKNFRAKDYL